METYNCLVTELKAATGNTDLPKFNTLNGKIKVPASGSYGLYNIPNGVEVRITVLGDNDISFSGSSVAKSKTLTGNGADKYLAIFGTEGAMADIEVENPYYINKVVSWAPNIAAFKYQTERTTLELYDNGGVLTGNIEELGSLTALISVSLGNNLVTGSVNSLAQLMVDNGRTSGTMQIYQSAGMTGIKVNGQNFAHAKVVFADGSFTATKES